MDAVFLLDEASRAEFLQLLLQSTGCTYICLWSCFPQTNCLMCLDGCYNEENIQPGSLSLYFEYRQLVFPLENDHRLVPGFGFRNNMPYIELGELELHNRASHPTQRQFYREAGIKTAVFMGCRNGEIELGSSNVVQLNMQMEMRTFFPEDFSRQLSPSAAAGDQLPGQPNDPNRPSSSSSSLRSFSTGSPDSSLIFTIPTAPSHPHPHLPTDQTTTTAAATVTTPSSLQAMSSSIIPADPHQATMQALSEMRNNIQLPSMETENAAITRAILAILTSPTSSSSSTSHQQNLQNLPNYNNYQRNPNATAFKRYTSSRLSAPSSSSSARASLRAQSMLKRAITFYRNFNLARREHLLRNRPTTTTNQLHHMMSERKRREKLNESFVALRSLLPSGTKKDKASVLISTREYLKSLRSQIEELDRRNRLLEAQVLPSKEAAGELVNERFNVRITPVPESASDQRIIDLRVSVRGERPIVDVIIHLLEFLKLDRSVSLMSIEANTNITESGSVNLVNLRLRIEGNGWDEATFQEAVRRLIADLAQ